MIYVTKDHQYSSPIPISNHPLHPIPPPLPLPFPAAPIETDLTLFSPPFRSFLRWQTWWRLHKSKQLLWLHSMLRWHCLWHAMPSWAEVWWEKGCVRLQCALLSRSCKMTCSDNLICALYANDFSAKIKFPELLTLIILFFPLLSSGEKQSVSTFSLTNADA